tara:strand:+ start:985 stop:1653 length:669 start_codon:yes stop_codon:yes gene_type:complete
MDLLKHTLYINLDGRTDRLEHVTNELMKMKIHAERVKAVKLTNGAIGCTMSHIKCLELAKKRDYEHVFICEDDILFLEPTLYKEKLQTLIDMKINWDVLIVGGNTAPPYQTITEDCIRVFHSQTTTGYIVKNHYYDTLIKNFKESANKLMANPEDKFHFALDKYWLRLQKENQFIMMIPPTVIQYESYSDIEEKDVRYEDLMLDMEKKWLQPQFKPNIMNFH